MDNIYHIPVLLPETIEFLSVNPDGIYIDGTLGGGGHTAEILKNLSNTGKIISFDADSFAVAHCKMRFADELNGSFSRLELVNQNFSTVTEHSELLGKISGFLLDLGVSSHQLDSASRGISHRINTRLDMRFGTTGLSAEELLQTASEHSLAHIFRNYGEEPFSHAIARRITERRKVFPLRTTNDLKILIQEIAPPHLLPRATARIFQAIRIAVNNELGVLESTLRGIIPMLQSGGRVVVISYHSLEDRIVKNIFREFSSVDHANLRILTPKPIVPTDNEITANSRARSAKLRAAEKI